MRRAAFLLLACLGLASAAHAQNGAVTGFCTLGATSAQVQGLPSTNRLQGLIPSCQVKVYLAGTQTAATIYSNITGTPLTNPFTASTIGQWSFYATNGESYDVVLSGGVAPLTYPSPVSLPGLMPGFGGSIFSGNINGEMYPAQCGKDNPPSWCSGTTPDAWYRAACTQLPAKGGFINLLGLTGTSALSFTCSTPTKQVITLQDPTSELFIGQSDGGIAFPQDNGSMILGPGVGQCQNGGGIHLAGTANITALFGPAHTDGSQESFAANGLCFFGATGATVSQGMIYTKRTFSNTTFEGNNGFVCNTACAKVVDAEAVIANNWFNVTDGVNSITGSPLIIQGTGLGSGCNVGPVSVSGGRYEHALGGGPEILVEGDGSGLVLACDIHISDVGIERNPTGTASSVGIQISDCKNCSVQNVIATGTSGGSAMVDVHQNASGSIANVTLQGISNVFGTYANTVTDNTLSAVPLPFGADPFVTTHYSNPGYVQPPVLPSTTLQSVGTDAMGGLGNFSTGSGSLGTNFFQTGCLSGQGLTCTYTRTNSTAPPGATFSQQVQITVNADPSIGFNGVQYGSAVSFAANQAYVASFWGKGDGTFTGVPTFLLWNSGSPPVYCQSTATNSFTTTWTPYSFICQPTSAGSSDLAAASLTPIGQTGTFWIGNFTFSPLTPMVPGSTLAANSSYGVGPTPGLLYSAAGTPLPTCNSGLNGNQRTVSDATSPTYLGTYTSGGAVTAAVICDGTNWKTY